MFSQVRHALAYLLYNIYLNCFDVIQSSTTLQIHDVKACTIAIYVS